MKKLLSMILASAVFMGTASVARVSAAEPDGTQENPYLIGSTADWSEFRKYISADENKGAGKYWKLTADLNFADASGNNSWVTPIGLCNRDGVGDAFKGNLNGDGHVIKNYTINCDGNFGDYGAFGLFSGIGGDAVVEKLGIENAVFRTGADWKYWAAGSLAGTVTGNAQINNCYVKNFSDQIAYPNGHFTHKGGLAGRIMDNATIENCYSLGYKYTACNNCSSGGGIVGTISSVNTAVKRCYSDTTIGIADAGGWGNAWYDLFYPDTTELPWPGKYWSQGTPVGYIGTKQTEEQLKAVPANVRGIFVADTEDVNDGYPVLKWQAAYENVYSINSVDDFRAFAEYVNNDPDGGKGNCWKLNTDIDFGGAEWKTLIGTHDYENNISKPFKGVFDGNGHTIKNYVVKCTHKKMTGLFGAIGDNAIIKNVGIKNVTVKIDQKWVWSTAGGLVGYVSGNAAVRKCYAKNVTMGIDDYVEKQHSISYGGALAGEVADNGIIEDCYSRGTNLAEGEVVLRGGIAGMVKDSGTLSNCYSDTTIAVSPKTSATVENCYYTEVPGWPWNTGGDKDYIYRGTKLDTNAELKKLASTLGKAYNSDNPASSINDGYPVLAWEYDVPALNGQGTEESPYEINGIEDLALILSYDQAADKHFRLMQDIDFEGNVWNTPIGDKLSPWEGTLDGNGHVIKNYVLKAEKQGKVNYLGLFGSLAENAKICNIGLENVTIGFDGDWGYNTVCGALAGRAADNVSIEGCYVKNVKFDNGGNTNCSFSVAGGLLGIADGDGVAIKNCYALDVKAENDCAASESGLVGQLLNFNDLSNCYTNTTVSMCDDAGQDKVHNSYCTAQTASAYDRTGKLVTNDVLKTIAFHLGSAYKGNGNGYPMLAWEQSDKDAVYSVVLENKDSEIVTDLENAEKIKSVKVQKTNSEQGKMYVAAYDKNGAFLRVDIAESVVGGSGEYNVDMQISDAERISVFIITDTLKPLTEVYSIMRLH